MSQRGKTTPSHATAKAAAHSVSFMPLHEFANLGIDRFVYVRPLDKEESRRLGLGSSNMSGEGGDDLYGVHSASGVLVEIVRGRRTAFTSALIHHFQPLSVH